MNVYRTQAADCRTRRDKGMCEFVSIGEDQVIEREKIIQWKIWRNFPKMYGQN